MKNLIFLVAFAFSTSAIAQSTTPRTGTNPAVTDNSFRNLSNGYKALADAASATVDTLTIIPSNFNTLVYITLTDSCVLSLRSVASSFRGDRMTVIIKAGTGAGKFVNFLGYSVLATKWGMASTGTKISPASTLDATIQFIFDGAKWIELSRSAQ